MKQLVHFGGFLLHRDCPEEKSLVFAGYSHNGEFYGVEPTSYSPRSHILSASVTFGMSCRRLKQRFNFNTFRALYPRPKGRGFTARLDNDKAQVKLISEKVYEIVQKIRKNKNLIGEIQLYYSEKKDGIVFAGGVQEAEVIELDVETDT